MVSKSVKTEKCIKNEGVKSVDDLYAKYFPNAYVQKLQEKIYEAYSRELHPRKASVL